MHDLDVTVLRLLDTERPAQPGGAVTCLAELTGPPPAGLPPATVDGGEHALRAPYARPGAPAASLRWAAAHLLRPVAALLQAVVYANVLANIELSEHRYQAAVAPLTTDSAFR